MSSFLKVIDVGMRSTIYSKFGDIMEFSDVNTGVLIYPKEVAFRLVSEKKGSSISEFASVWRTSIAPDLKRQNTPVARRGFTVPYTSDGETLYRNVKGMPVSLEYEVCFWSKDLDKLNQVAELYLFWQQNDPNLNIYYNTIYPIELDLKFGALVDESNVPSMMDKGNHFCYRAQISLDGWIFSATDDDSDVIYKIELVMYNSENLSDYRECIYEEDEYDSTTESDLRLGEERAYGIYEYDVDAYTITIYNDQTDYFTAGDKVRIVDEDYDGEMYTIVSASYDSSEYTVLTVSEEIQDFDSDYCLVSVTRID